MKLVSGTLGLGVVLHRNTRRQLERLARSFALNRASPECPPFQVAFLDDSPGNALEPLVRELAPEAAYHVSPCHGGFGRGHNVLMRDFFASGVEAYVCVNPEVVLHPDCLFELMREVERQPRAGLVEALRFPDEHPKHYDARTHHTKWCSGCVLLITRALYQTVGGYDENLFMSCEDVDLSWRARAGGFSTSVAPRALAHHSGGDPAHEPLAHHHRLRSGIYLAHKYGDPEAAKGWMADYVSTGGAAFDMPAPPSLSEEHKRVAELQHLFSLAEVRWC